MKPVTHFLTSVLIGAVLAILLHSLTSCVTTPEPPQLCEAVGEQRFNTYKSEGKQLIAAEVLQGGIEAYVFGTVSGNVVVPTDVDYLAPVGTPPPPANLGITKVGVCVASKSTTEFTIYHQSLAPGEQAEQRVWPRLVRED